MQKVLFRILLAIGFLLPFSNGLASKTTLRVANWAGARELKLERRIAAAFEKRHPEIRVSVETIPSGYKEKILTGIASGNPPDVFLLDATIIPAFLNQNVLVNLKPYVKKYKVDLSAYFPNVLRIAERDSALFALPKDFTPMVMYFNKRLFDAEGLSYPALRAGPGGITCSSHKGLQKILMAMAGSINLAPWFRTASTSGFPGCGATAAMC